MDLAENIKYDVFVEKRHDSESRVTYNRIIENKDNLIEKLFFITIQFLFYKKSKLNILSFN